MSKFKLGLTICISHGSTKETGAGEREREKKKEREGREREWELVYMIVELARQVQNSQDFLSGRAGGYVVAPKETTRFQVFSIDWIRIVSFLRLSRIISFINSTGCRC